MINKRLRVGVDIDGVLIDTDITAYLRFCEQNLSWDIDYGALRTHSWHEAIGSRPEAEIGESFERFLVEVEKSQKPIEGAHDSLKKISIVADIYLITARTGAVRVVTEEFIQEHLFDLRYHELSMDNFHKKHQKIIEYGIDYYVDDSYREISLILQDPSIATRIIPFPSFHSVHRWKEVKDERIHWLDAWDEITDGLHDDFHAGIRKKAWEEIARVIAV